MTTETQNKIDVEVDNVVPLNAGTGKQSDETVDFPPRKKQMLAVVSQLYTLATNGKLEGLVFAAVTADGAMTGSYNYTSPGAGLSAVGIVESVKFGLLKSVQESVESAQSDAKPADQPSSQPTSETSNSTGDIA